MSEVFLDEFGGGGTVTGHTPTVQTWTDGSEPWSAIIGGVTMDIAGGAAVHDGVSSMCGNIFPQTIPLGSFGNDGWTATLRFTKPEEGSSAFLLIERYTSGTPGLTTPRQSYEVVVYPTFISLRMNDDDVSDTVSGFFDYVTTTGVEHELKMICVQPEGPFSPTLYVYVDGELIGSIVGFSAFPLVSHVTLGMFAPTFVFSYLQITDTADVPEPPEPPVFSAFWTDHVNTEELP